MEQILMGFIMVVILGSIVGVILYYLGKLTCGCLSIILMIWLCVWIFKKCSVYF
ncbi:hypothetical protein [Fusobacterium massiliense]|uniref:hypothetical protein n=1 Tax=Fusobacterium massiliense TaxID=1852365 RepID=UPI0028E3BCC2|nr:hypothetical protein [Fusobacterium massiliense]